MSRIFNPTFPPTFTTSEVEKFFKGHFSAVKLYRLDMDPLDPACKGPCKGHFRPAYYYDARVKGGLIAPKARDAQLTATGTSRANSPRRYTFQDIVWLSLLVKLEMALKNAKPPTPNAYQRAAVVVSLLRKRFGPKCPSASRVLVVTHDIYLLTDDLRAECLTPKRQGQLAFTPFLTDRIDAEVRGRLVVLADKKDIRPELVPNGENAHASASTSA